MGVHTATLWHLVQQQLPIPDTADLRTSTQVYPLDVARLQYFDQHLGGPNIGCLSDSHGGRYTVADRDALRPLQYCAMFLVHSTSEWTARGTVYMSGLHLESLILLA